MVPKESFTPGAWFKKGDADLRSAKILLREGDMEIAAFHIQQALEKYLKGFLLSKGWQLRKVHELDVLLNDAVQYKHELEKFRELCEMATEYYLSERYPYEESFQIPQAEIELQIHQTEDLRKDLLTER